MSTSRVERTASRTPDVHCASKDVGNQRARAENHHQDDNVQENGFQMSVDWDKSELLILWLTFASTTTIHAHPMPPACCHQRKARSAPYLSFLREFLLPAQRPFCCPSVFRILPPPVVPAGEQRIGCCSLRNGTDRCPLTPADGRAGRAGANGV